MPEINYRPRPIPFPGKSYPRSVIGKYTGRIPRPPSNGGGGSEEPGCVFTTASPLPNGTVGDPYFQSIDADGSPVLTVIAGSVPDGTEMSPGGIITGTPTTDGTFVFTVQGTPPSGGVCTKEFSITIDPASFTPNSLPGLILWLNAYQYVGQADMTAIGGAGLEWIDQSGNGNDATAGGVVQFRTAGIAGTHPALQFTGDSLIIPAIAIALDGDFTIAVIAETLGDTAWLGNNAVNVQVRRRRSGVNNLSFFPGTGSEVISDGFAATAGDLMMVVWRRSGDTVSFRENKIARGSGTNGGAFTVNRIGNSAFVGGIGDCGEIMMWDQFHDDTALDALYDDYAQPEWPLP